MTGINRRGLLKGSIFGMAAAGASVIPVAVQAQAAAPVKTEEYDVVVIGCGCAGMAAALEAADKGAKVVILEKMSPSGRQHDFCRRSLQRHQHLCPESAGTSRHDRRFLS